MSPGPRDVATDWMKQGWNGSPRKNPCPSSGDDPGGSGRGGGGTGTGNCGQGWASSAAAEPSSTAVPRTRVRNMVHPPGATGAYPGGSQVPCREANGPRERAEPEPTGCEPGSAYRDPGLGTLGP